jgi:AcrR family transcriptional regulator
MTTEGQAELWESISPAASRRLLAAAVEAFAEQGYHATTTRAIAARAGMSPAGLYVHYRSKSDLLFEIARLGHTAVLAAVEHELEAAAEPPARIAAFVRASTVWHARNQTAARVIQYELRALDEQQFAEIRPLRARFVKLLRREIQAGRRSGAFAVEDVAAATNALLSLTIDVARWYRPRGNPSPERLGAAYGRVAVAMLT